MAPPCSAATPGGCGGSGCGTIFRLNPAGLGRTVFYRFSDQHESYWPVGALSFDSAGNMYGTTAVGGTVGNGTVFKLVRNGSQWTYSMIYDFEDANKGWAPVAGVIVDSAGNLYGTTVNGGGRSSYGVVYELSPSAGGWSSRVLHPFYPERTTMAGGRKPASSWTPPATCMEQRRVEGPVAVVPSLNFRHRATTGTTARFATLLRLPTAGRTT